MTPAVIDELESLARELDATTGFVAREKVRAKLRAAIFKNRTSLIADSRKLAAIESNLRQHANAGSNAGAHGLANECLKIIEGPGSEPPLGEKVLLGEEE